MNQDRRTTVDEKRLSYKMTDCKKGITEWVEEIKKKMEKKKMKKEMKKTGKTFGIATYWKDKEPPHTMAVAVGRRALVVDLLNLKSEVPSELKSFMSKSTVGGYQINTQFSKLGFTFRTNKVDCIKEEVCEVDFFKGRFGELSIDDAVGAAGEAYLSYKVAKKVA